MKLYDCDLHIHGSYSGGVSKNMLIPEISMQAKLKGLDIIASGDILNKEWLRHLKENLCEENGCFRDKKIDVFYILGGEINDVSNVHHLFFLPNFESAEILRKKLSSYGRLDGYGFGRPSISLNAEKLACIIEEANGIIGPAHAFTPYYSMYSHFSSLQSCYGAQVKNVFFMELGLSADSYFADLISGNHGLAFITCSDAHSPWPHRLGREFTRIELKKPCFEDLKKVFMEERERIKLNVGLDPREGKYHCTACNRCYSKYSIESAKGLNWRCPRCKGTIKKGVRDRIMELADFKEEVHPEFRAPYLHIIPLAEIILMATKAKDINSEAVQSTWHELVSKFGSEIKVLLDVELSEIQKIDEKVARHIGAFRQGNVLYISGGGGKYGEPIICASQEELELKKLELRDVLECNSTFKGQKTLAEF
ncbi:MAG: TIGR00375 family protein [Candidatus Diapherotrites archaeon]|nr:TIGR00375 family protein [Candidatus Diapherotrites archaeon]